ncbi:MAG: HlyD family efflux transporter periplasmic adaptor subunit [Phycisphaerales bacterium]|nr:HlyD family efflux transporter periplasmic adaptor subunit [Phycisphaerales bacterium]
MHKLELQVTIETDRARLDFLRTRRDLFDKLRGLRAVSELGFKSAEAEFVSLEKSLEENAKALTQTRADLEQARQRREQFAQYHVVPLTLDQALEPLRAAVTVQERLIDELSLEHTMLVLKSPMDGVVSQILRGAGESVRSGEPILTVVSTRPAQIIAYIAPAQASRLTAGTPVRLETMRESNSRQTLDSRIEAVGPQVEQIPTRLWRNPAVPEWGWPVKIMVPTELEILCGETVGVIGLRRGLSEDTSGIPASKSM